MKEYKVVFAPSIESNANDWFYQKADTHSEAEAVLNAIANYTLKLHELNLMKDYSNSGWVEQLIDGEWLEINGDGELCWFNKL